jgi:hypothetical protein
MALKALSLTSLRYDHDSSLPKTLKESFASEGGRIHASKQKTRAVALPNSLSSCACKQLQAAGCVLGEIREKRDEDNLVSFHGLDIAPGLPDGLFAYQKSLFFKFWKALEWKMLVYFMAIRFILLLGTYMVMPVWYILLSFGVFSHFGIQIAPRKIWQPCIALMQVIMLVHLI